MPLKNANGNSTHGKNKSSNANQKTSQQKEDWDSNRKNISLIGSNDEFPILHYVASRGSSNFYEFKKPFINYVFRKYKDMGRSFENNMEELYYPPRIKPPARLPRPRIPSVDAEGNPVLDENGDPVMVRDMHER
jgi:hypothetical protein